MVTPDPSAVETALGQSTAYFLVSADGRILRASSALLRRLSRSEAELISTDGASLDHSSEDFWCRSAEARAQGKDWEGRVRFGLSESHDIRLTMSKVGGDPCAYLCLCSPEDKQTEQRLDELQGRFQRAVAGTTDGLWDFNPATGEVWYADQFKRLLGFPEDEFDSFGNELEAFASRLHPEDKPRTLKAIDEHLRGNGPYNIEYRLRLHDHSYKWFHARGQAMRDEAGEVLRMSGSISDIQARRDATFSAEEKGRELQTIIDAIPGFVFYKDDKNTILDLNRAAAESIGRPREEIRGRATEEFFPAEDAAEYLKDDLQVIGLGQPRLGIVEPFQSKDERLHIRTDKIPLPGPSGQFDRLVAIVTDITEVTRAREQAEAASQAKSEFLANMSHEIRTPMNGVIGMTGLLMDTELTNEQQRYAETVRSSAEALLSLINDILDVSKIEAGKLEMEELEFDLRSTLDEFSEMVAVRAQTKGLEFVCSCEADVPTQLTGDPGRLRQILVNLAGNAIKFAEDGTVAVQVTRVSVDNEGVLLRFSVEDSGIGIPTEKVEQLFDQFSQVDASTTRKYGGSGLGLAISKQLAEMMGGEIGVESIPGEGSTFWFTARFQAQTSVDPPCPEHQHCGKCVLLVDSHDASRAVCGAMLESWGLHCRQENSAGAALRALESSEDVGQDFPIVVLDSETVGLDPLMSLVDNRDDVQLVVLAPLIRAAQLRAQVTHAPIVSKPVRASELFDAICGRFAQSDSSHLSHPPADLPQKLKTSHARILLVEDNIVNQKVALGLLRKLGLSAEAVANGLEAVRALESMPFDLVLMDCQMPEMDGYEATAIVRDPSSSVSNHDVPIIAMTANAMGGDREKCLKAGMTDYLSKPVLRDELRLVLEKWLG